MIKELAKNLRDFKDIFLKQKKDIIILVIVNLIMITITGISPALIATIINGFINQNYEQIIWVLVLLILLKGLNILMTVVDTKKFFSFRKEIVLSIKKEISKNIINLDMSTFETSGKGKFIQRLNNDPNILGDEMYQIKLYLSNMIVNFGAVIYIMYLDIISGLIFAIFLSIILLFRYAAVKKKNEYYKKFYLEKEKSGNIITEMYNGIKDIKQLNMQNKLSKRADKTYENAEYYAYRGDYIYSLCYNLTVILQWVAIGAVILYNIFAIKNNMAVVETFVTIFTYRTSVFVFSDCYADFLNKLININLVLSRLGEFIKGKEDNNKLSDKECLGNIEFKNVNFKYDKRLILKNCTFSIKPNTTYALIGKNGAGKTTILNLVTKMYKPDSGTISIDGGNIQKLSDFYIRSNVSIISQASYLFDMSIRDNLLMVKPDLTEEEMISICKKVKIHDDIMKLPEQYDTEIGEGGDFLSRGQRQRIALARTLLINSKIILFDEPTTALDANSEELILSIIKELEKDHTIIVVSHNAKLVSKIKNILVLEKGKIVANGKYSDTYKKYLGEIDK